MWVTLESMGLQTLTSKAGKSYEAFVVTGTKKGYKNEPDGPWKKNFMPWKDQEFIAILENIGVGGRAEITSVKNGQNWDVTEVKPLDAKGGGGGGRAPAPRSPGDEAPAPQQQAPAPMPIVYNQMVGDGDALSCACVKAAGNLVSHMLSVSENFKNLIKKTATVEVVAQTVIDLAIDMYKQVKAGVEPAVKLESDPSGLVQPQGGPVEEDPEIPF